MAKVAVTEIMDFPQDYIFPAYRQMSKIDREPSNIVVLFIFSISNVTVFSRIPTTLVSYVYFFTLQKTIYTAL